MRLYQFVTLSVLLGLAFTLLGCGSESVYNYADNDQMRIIAMRLFAEVELNGLSFGTGKLPYRDGEPFAACDNGRIIISYDVFSSLTEDQLETIIAHEVGHCSFKKGHDTDKGRYAPQDCPNSVMYPSEMLRTCWLLHKVEYLQDLRK